MEPKTPVAQSLYWHFIQLMRARLSEIVKQRKAVDEELEALTTQLKSLDANNEIIALENQADAYENAAQEAIKAGDQSHAEALRTRALWVRRAVREKRSGLSGCPIVEYRP